MLFEIRKGMLFWSIAPDTESEGYGDTKPRKPWLGYVLDDWNGGCVRLCRINEVTSVVDDDANATAYVLPEKLYYQDDKADAEKAYRAACEMYLAQMLKEVLDFMEESGIRDSKLEDEISLAIGP